MSIFHMLSTDRDISYLRIAMIIILPPLGFIIPYLLLSTWGVESTEGRVLLYGFFIMLGLGIPYWVLKLGIHEAHLRDGKEKELELEDLPKDKSQV